MAEEKLNNNIEKTGQADILYISSVPVTLLYSGAAFMYRLFEGIEKRLIIFQGIKLHEGSQLKDTNYNYYDPAFNRLRLTRFTEIYNILNIVRNFLFIPDKLNRIIKDKKPKVIITVSNGLLWILAYRVAKRYKLPLVILIHDDMSSYYSKKKISGKLIHFLFRKVYRSARMRFCISELMKERYDERYQVTAEVLYPLQGKQEAGIICTPIKLQKAITIAYAGSLDAGPYADMIVMLANELKAVNGSLIVFANTFPEQLASVSNIINYGFLTPDLLQQKLEENAHALFVPFPFYDSALNVELAFPSKIADYTIARKPLLIWAPPDCALSTWFRSLPVPVGVLVESLDKTAVAEAIIQVSDPLNNASWGENSFNMGQAYFGNEKQQQFFFSKIKEVIG